MNLRLFFYILIIVSCTIQAQTLDEAKNLYKEGRFAEALPVFQSEYLSKPDDAALNQWLGVSLYETGNIVKAQQYLQVASKKNLPESYIYLGELYSNMYRFDDAEKEFAKYEKAKRRDKAALAKLAEKRAYAEGLRRMIHRTENIQIIDSIIVPKPGFLVAYHLSAIAGSLLPMNEFFRNNSIALPVFLNERKDKVYFSQNDSVKGMDIFSMEKLLDNFGNQKRMPENINDGGDQAYPFVMSDGLTTYFASTGHNSIGGYDLYVTRYNLSSDSYLNPTQLNMPFNSPFNDYMLAVDEEKGVGWFASDRFQPKDSVCIYTFIPNQQVNLIESDDENYLARRARIAAIHDTWQPGTDYSLQIASAKENRLQKSVEPQGDFELVIDDARTYRRLSDFKNAAARDIYSKVISLQKEFERNEQELLAKREQYAQSNESAKRNLAASLLSLEQNSEKLYRQIRQLIVQSRNQEIRNSF